MGWKIIHSESSCGWGGQEKRILLEMEAARKRGCDVHVACTPEAVLGQKAREKGFAVHALGMRRWFRPGALASAWRLLRQERFDLVHTHSSADSWLFGFAARSIGRKGPRVMRTRHLSTPVRGAFVYTRLNDRILTTGQSIRRHLIEKGVPAEKITSLPTGVDLEKFSPATVSRALRKELGFDAQTVLIGNVAVLRSWKGHDDFLDAAKILHARFPQTQFVIAGDGPQKERLAGRIAAENLSGFVRLLGYREDVPDVLAAMDIFLFTSYANEGVPQAVAQAMAMQKPVVATKTGSIEDLLQDGETGFLVAARDVPAMAEQCAFFMEHPDKAKAMGAAAGAFVRENFSLHGMEERLWKAYCELLR